PSGRAYAVPSPFGAGKALPTTTWDFVTVAPRLLECARRQGSGQTNVWSGALVPTPNSLGCVSSCFAREEVSCRLRLQTALLLSFGAGRLPPWVMHRPLSLETDQ